MIYVVCWTILIGIFKENDFKYSSDKEQWKRYGWRLVIEIPVIVLPIYFLVYDITLHKRSTLLHKDRVQVKRLSLNPKYAFSHPSWPYDRRLLKKEEEMLNDLPHLARKQMFWLIYEYTNAVFTVLVIVFHILPSIRRTAMKQIMIIPSKV